MPQARETQPPTLNPLLPRECFYPAFLPAPQKRGEERRQGTFLPL